MPNHAKSTVFTRYSSDINAIPDHNTDLHPDTLLKGCSRYIQVQGRNIWRFDHVHEVLHRAACSTAGPLYLTRGLVVVQSVFRPHITLINLPNRHYQDLTGFEGISQNPQNHSVLGRGFGVLAGTAKPPLRPASQVVVRVSSRCYFGIMYA